MKGRHEDPSKTRSFFSNTLHWPSGPIASHMLIHGLKKQYTALRSASLMNKMIISCEVWGGSQVYCVPKIYAKIHLWIITTQTCVITGRANAQMIHILYNSRIVLQSSFLHNDATTAIVSAISWKFATGRLHGSIFFVSLWPQVRVIHSGIKLHSVVVSNIIPSLKEIGS